MPLHRGKLARKVIIGEIRSLTRDDLAQLHEDRALPVTAKLRDTHRRVARMFAAGLRIYEIVERTGYSYQRVWTLSKDPAFQNLISELRKDEDESYDRARDEFYEHLFSNGIRAQRHLADRFEKLDDEGELMPTRDALAVAEFAADRTGYGKKNTTVNVNVDYAKNLEDAIRRSGKMIDVTPSQPNPGTLRRRA